MKAIAKILLASTPFVLPNNLCLPRDALNRPLFIRATQGDSCRRGPNWQRGQPCRSKRDAGRPYDRARRDLSWYLRKIRRISAHATSACSGMLKVAAPEIELHDVCRCWTSGIMCHRSASISRAMRNGPKSTGSTHLDRDRGNSAWQRGRGRNGHGHGPPNAAVIGDL
jgi:hypothetical protein